jgi:hypothetical protein
MGRPINKKYIGNTSQSGQQIQATAYFGGSPGPVTAWINKQVATNTYEMVAEDGSVSGRVQLAQGGVALNPGEANVLVTPYGASGSGATATARMGAFSATVAVSGTGAITADYDIGDTVTVGGGTSTAAAIFNVSGIVVGQMALNAAGFNYNAGNQITIGGAGWVSNVVVAVQTVDAAGGITGFVQVAGGGIRNAAKIDTVSGTTLIGSSGNADTSGTGATFNVRWGVANVAVAGAGVYSVLPSNPATTSTSGSGSGATLNVGYNVTNVVVTNGGSDFDAAAVTFTPAGAAATATVNAAGSISSVSVTNPGPTVTAVPTVAVGPLNSVQYAQEIRNRTVWTFDNNTFEWIMDDQDLVTSDQARIQSA